jgi:transglutaminase-like putative cysteine protease
MRLSAPLRLTIYAAIATIATSVSLMSVFSTSAWLVPVVGAIVLVAGACALVRWSPLPSAFEAFTAAIAVVLWVTFLYARKWSHFGFIPGRTAFRHLGHLARHGFTDVHKLPTPVPTHKGLVLLTVIGVAAIALIVDLLAVTLRRAALAGLPLLALFTLCAATGRDGVNIIAFMSAAGGYLLLLYIDNRERVTRWGAAVGSGSRARPAPTWSTDPSSAPAPATLGRRVGAAAIGVSVVVPLLIPGLHGGIDRHHQGDGTGIGGGNVHTFDPIVFVGNALGAQVNKPILTYTTTTTDPGYLRLTSLDTYHAGSFSAAELKAPQNARVSNGLNVAQPSATTYQTRISFNNGYQFRWLPVPTTAMSVRIDGDWRYDPQTATIFSASTTTSGSHYTVQSSPNRPTPNELANDPSAVPNLQLVDLYIGGVSNRVKDLARQLTEHAHSNYDAALDIQRYLTSRRFTYDPTVKADTSKDPLGDFLFHTQKGFCQQFATAMAVMSRVAGIPSRVAVGFTAGTKKPDGTYQVTTHDAHAWPELWFPKYGWLPFEPTPRRDGQAQTPPYARVRPNSAGGAVSPDPKVSRAPQPGGVKGDLPIKGQGTKGAPISGGSGGTSASDLALLFALAALALAVLLIAIPAMIRIGTRRRRWRRLRDNPNLVAEAWAELRDSAADAGAPWDEAGTPRTLAAALMTWTGSTSDVDAALRRLTTAEERDRYAATPPPVTGDLRADTEAVRTALVHDKSRTRRLLILLLPTSTMRILRAKISRLADAIDYLERAPGRAIARLRASPGPS